jgi:hypothetical protein
MNIAAMMNFDLIRWRRLGAAITLAMLICGAPASAWCASTDLWVAFFGGSIDSYTSKQLKKSGMPKPIHLGTLGSATGLAFDKSHNLWAVVGGYQVVQFAAAQLKKLKKNPSPTPRVTITSTFADIVGCNFDQQGNLWLVDAGNNSIDELSKAQLDAGSGNVAAPALVISSTDLSDPGFVAFDGLGNAWVGSFVGNQIAEFSASQLTSGGSKLPTVLLSDDGSGTSLSSPAEVALDKSGNLWVANYGADTVVEYAKDQLTSSGNPAPTVKLSSAIFDRPLGVAFDSKGDLAVMNYTSGTIAKFTAAQLKTSGAPVPKVSVRGTETENQQIVFGPVP